MKTVIRMKWDKNQNNFSKDLIKSIFIGFGHYTPNVIICDKPGKAFIEF